MKPFEIQGAQLKLGGVQLEAGNTGVVIPGVTRATSYKVEEVNDTGDQTITIENSPLVVDAAAFAAFNNAETFVEGYASYNVDLDDNLYIDDIEVDNEGSYTQQEASIAESSDMWAYGGGNSADAFSPFTNGDWFQIPFRPKMRAGEIEREGGSGGSSNLSELNDVGLDGPSQGQVLMYNSDREVWENQNISGGGTADTGFTSFSDEDIIGQGTINIVPNQNFKGDGQYLTIYPTIGQDAPHIHIAAGSGGDLMLGTDVSYVDVNHDGNVKVQANDNNGNVAQWQFKSDGNIAFPDGSIQTTAYVPTTSAQTGYFNLIQGATNNDGRWDGEAALMDGTGNSYVSYSYYDDNSGNMIGGIAKFDSTGAKLWNKNYVESSGNYQYPRISSLEYFDLAPFIVALGYHTNTNSQLDEGFMFMIDPDGNMNNQFSVNFNSTAGMMVEDGVFYNENGPAAVVAGQTYNESKTFTLTPIAPSTVDKLYVTWSDLNASGLVIGQNPTYNSNYGMNGNILQYQVVSSVNGNGTSDYPYMYVTVTYNEAGVYSVTRINGGSGYDQFSNQTLKVLGSNFGGTDGVNDLTFDFDFATFTNAGQNYDNPAGLTNVQGTAISDVYMSFYGGFDFSTVIGSTQTDMFGVYMGNQASIVKLGQNSWSVDVGSTDYEQLHSVAVDPLNGDVYAVGRYYDNTTNKSGAVLKYDISGNLQWAKLIDSNDNTGIELRSVEVVPYGEGTGIIVTGDDGSVTKLDGSNGDIVWQVAVDTNNVSLNNDPIGTATAEGDYIVLINEDNNYHLYVTKLSGADGSVVWQKDISYHQGYNWNGELNMFNDFDATNIDCDDTSITIAGSTYYYDGNNGIRRGYVINIPSDGTGNGSYGEWILGDVSVSWSTRSTSSVSFTPVSLQSAVNNYPLSMNITDVNDNVTSTPIGGTSTAFVGIERHSASEGDNTVTLASEHNSKFLYYNGSNGNSTIRIPSNNDVALPIGYTVTVVMDYFNNNRIYVNNNTGSQNATINASGFQDGTSNYWLFGATADKCGVYTIMKVDTDRWMLAGPDVTVD